MTVTTCSARALAVLLAIFGLAVPAANAGIDRGISVEPYVAPTSNAPTSESLRRFLANDRRDHPSLGVDTASRLSASSVAYRDSASVWSSGLVVGATASSFAIGVIATMLLVRRRTKIVS